MKQAETLLQLEYSVSSVPVPGEEESGDLYLVSPIPAGTLIAVVDGSGHGPEAALAARLAIATLDSHLREGVIPLVKRCHERLKGTRGVVMSLASFDERDGTLTWMGIGNVEGVVLGAKGSPHSRHEYLRLRSGVVGGTLPSLNASFMPMMQGDTLIFVTDGIRSGFAKGLSTSDPPQLIADRILAEHSKGSDDALVLVARYLK